MNMSWTFQDKEIKHRAEIPSYGRGGIVIMDDAGTVLEEVPFVEVAVTEQSLRRAVDAIFRDEGGSGEFPLSEDMKELIELLWGEIDALRGVAE